MVPCRKIKGFLYRVVCYGSIFLRYDLIASFLEKISYIVVNVYLPFNIGLYLEACTLTGLLPVKIHLCTTICLILICLCISPGCPVDQYIDDSLKLCDVKTVKHTSAIIVEIYSGCPFLINIGGGLYCHGSRSRRAGSRSYLQPVYIASQCPRIMRSI